MKQERYNMQNTYVSVNLTQDFTDEQKGTARTNINAADASAFNRLSNTVGNLSYQVSANTGAITELKSLFAPEVATATVNYADTSVPLIGDLRFLKVYCTITGTNACQVKVMPADGSLKIGAFRAITYYYNQHQSTDTLRHFLPFDAPVSEEYSGYIDYASDSFGTIDIDVLLTDKTSVHLTVWFKADTANSLYRFYLVEEVRK